MDNAADIVLVKCGKEKAQYTTWKHTLANVVAEPRKRLAWFKIYGNNDGTNDGESCCGGRCVQAVMSA